MSDTMLLLLEFFLLDIGIVAAVLFLVFYAKKRQLPKEIRYPIILFTITILGFSLAYVSLVGIRVQEMGFTEFFIEDIVPLPYWVGVGIIISATFLMIRFLMDKRVIMLFVFSSILLMISFRMVFPIVFENVSSYEPDVTTYIQVADSWTRSGIDLGHEGNYQHDYPMSFLIAYAFIRFGVPLRTFFLLAPFFIYAIDLVFVYLIGVEITPAKKDAAVAAFLLSFSSLNYWVSVHYCPDLTGTLFYLLSLYLTVRFAKKRTWNVKSLAPVLFSIFALILSHHLATLYLIVTLFGLAFSTWLFKPKFAKSKSFLFLGVFTYTLWFIYGTFMYPSFFNIYVYFHWGGSPIWLSQATLLDQATFLLYPIFVLSLFTYSFLRLLKVGRITDLIRLPQKLKEARARKGGEQAKLFTYSFGSILITVLLLVGFLIPATFPTRVLEVFLIGLYPLAGWTLAKASYTNPSKKKAVLVLILLIFLLLTGVHRYYRQIQRRILLA